MGHQIVDIFFQVGPGAADRVDLALPNHLGQREAHFGAAHRPRHRQQHLTTFVDKGAVGFGGINERGGVEMAIMLFNKCLDGVCVVHASVIQF